MRARFEIKATTQNDKTAWFWRLVGGNGEVVCTSHPESFQYPTDAAAAALRARKIARLAKVDR